MNWENFKPLVVCLGYRLLGTNLSQS